MNFKRLLFLALTALGIIGAAFFLIDKRLFAGMAAGFVTGALNISAIIFTVRGTITPDSKKGAALISVLVYVIKLVVIGAIIALVIIFRKDYSIKGFLMGFTLTLLLLMTEYIITVLTKTQEKK